MHILPEAEEADAPEAGNVERQARVAHHNNGLTLFLLA